MSYPIPLFPRRTLRPSLTMSRLVAYPIQCRAFTCLLYRIVRLVCAAARSVHVRVRVRVRVRVCACVPCVARPDLPAYPIRFCQPTLHSSANLPYTDLPTYPILLPARVGKPTTTLLLSFL
jgi:hypothetical protein